MTTNNSDIFLKYLLSGCTPSDAKTLLDQITVEEMVYQLASLPSESFMPYNSDTEDVSSDFGALDEKYLGNLIIRSLDSLLDKRHYESLFNNEQIMSVIKEGITDANYYVKRLISKHLRKFVENGGKNPDVYEVVWNLLFDKEYCVFEDASKSVCVISSRRDEELFLNQERLGLLLRYLSGDLESEKLDKVTMALRILEFCTMLGKTNTECFELLKNNQVYEYIFRLFMEQDVLVKLNCLEILDSMIPLMKKLKFESKGSRDFVKYTVDVFTGKDEDAEEDLIAGPLLRFFSTIVLLDNVLNEEEVLLFSNYVADNIVNNRKQKLVQYYSSLASFGSLYVRGYLNESVSESFLEIVRNCTNEDVLYACLESLQFVSQTGDLSRSKFVLQASSCIISAISKFPFGDVREACFSFLANSLDFDQVTELLIKSEKESKLLSTQENLYETTLTKRRLIKKFLSRVEELYEESSCPLSDTLVRRLKSI